MVSAASQVPSSHTSPHPEALHVVSGAIVNHTYDRVTTREAIQAHA
jgi:quercetin dioxygenase-like cupin family protein